MYRDTDNNREYQREWARKRKEDEDYVARTKEAKYRNKCSKVAWVKAYRATLVCEQCGADEKIEFHHVDKSTKKATICRMTGANYGLKAIQREIAKCIPLCHTCHKLLHDAEYGADGDYNGTGEEECT